MAKISIKTNLERIVIEKTNCRKTFSNNIENFQKNMKQNKNDQMRNEI
jgi:hypothetical protein